jgi:formylglycine-generating enzyme required for sulfatase activity
MDTTRTSADSDDATAKWSTWLHWAIGIAVVAALAYLLWPKGNDSAARVLQEQTQAARKLQEDTARSLGLPREEVLDLGGGIALKLSLIPPGRFTMGSPSSEDGRQDIEAPHQVTITRSFYMSATEITRRQWRAVVEGQTEAIPGESMPQESVPWSGAVEFCRRLSEKAQRVVRLPTEAQWEYACRAGTTTAFWFGDSMHPDRAAFDATYRYGDAPKGRRRSEASPVGSFDHNAWGLFDMHGNAWEWCSDWLGEYPSEALTDPTGPPTGSRRVLRGGAWSRGPDMARSARRDACAPGDPYPVCGFRIVVEPKPPPPTTAN